MSAEPRWKIFFSYSFLFLTISYKSLVFDTINKNFVIPLRLKFRSRSKQKTGYQLFTCILFFSLILRPIHEMAHSAKWETVWKKAAREMSQCFPGLFTIWNSYIVMRGKWIKLHNKKQKLWRLNHKNFWVFSHNLGPLYKNVKKTNEITSKRYIVNLKNYMSCILVVITTIFVFQSRMTCWVKF